MSSRENFNLASPIGDVLFDKLKWNQTRKKKQNMQQGRKSPKLLSNKKIKLWDIESSVAKNTRLMLANQVDHIECILIICTYGSLKPTT
jgi:hypothetical protein